MCFEVGKHALCSPIVTLCTYKYSDYIAERAHQFYYNKRRKKQVNTSHIRRTTKRVVKPLKNLMIFYK